MQNNLVEMQAERLKELQREAANHRLARNVEKQENQGLLQNALNALNVFNKNEARNQR